MEPDDYAAFPGYGGTTRPSGNMEPVGLRRRTATSPRRCAVRSKAEVSGAEVLHRRGGRHRHDPAQRPASWPRSSPRSPAAAGRWPTAGPFCRSTRPVGCSATSRSTAGGPRPCALGPTSQSPGGPGLDRPAQPALRPVHEPGQQAVVAGPRRVRDGGDVGLRPRLARRPPRRYRRASRKRLFEGWTLLAAIAARTTRIRLGVLVSSNTFRHPAILLKEAVTLDHISGGRLILGIGTGWNEDEHRRYGIDLPRAKGACGPVRGSRRRHQPAHEPGANDVRPAASTGSRTRVSNRRRSNGRASRS